MLAQFYEYHRNCKKMVLGDAGEKLDICMHFKLCLRVHSLISIQHKSIKLGHVIHLNVIFYVVVSNYRLIKI